MNCPVCKTEPLALAERQGIEIDYCPACRGVWLDRGELDKLVAGAPDDRQPRGPDVDDDGHSQSRDRGSSRGRRRESWLGELFELGS